MSRIFTPDQELIDRLLLSDTDAFEELYRRYWHSLYNYSHKKLHSSEDARKIVRDIFISLWENRESYPADFHVSAHLYGEVRRMVVACLKDRLDAMESGEEFLEEFSLEALQQARVPVIKKYDPPAETEIMRQNTLSDRPEKPAIYLNMRWLIQAMSSKIYS